MGLVGCGGGAVVVWWGCGGASGGVSTVRGWSGGAHIQGQE